MEDTWYLRLKKKLKSSSRFKRETLVIICWSWKLEDLAALAENFDLQFYLGINRVRNEYRNNF